MSGHHHRSGLKPRKGFKSRHASKSAVKERNKGKVDSGRTSSKAAIQQSKLDRRNHAMQVHRNKRAEVIRANRIFDGRNGAAKIVAIVPLTDDSNSLELVARLNKSIDVESMVDAAAISHRAELPRFKKRVHYLTPQRTFADLLECAKAADYVVFGLSATEEVDELGELTIRSIQSQGVSSVAACVHNLGQVEPVKRQPDVKKSLLSFMQFFFPKLDKIYACDTSSDCLNLVRYIGTSNPQGIHWRDSRSYIVADDVSVAQDGTLCINGIVRGTANFDPDRLTHITGIGDFKVDRVEDVEKVRQADGGMRDDSAVLLPTENADDDSSWVVDDQDDVMLAEDVEQAKGARLDDHHYFSDEEYEVKRTMPKQLPAGMSEYQASWIPDTGSDESDMEDTQAESSFAANDGMSDNMSATANDEDDDDHDTDGTMEDDDMHVEFSEAEEQKQLDAYRNRTRERDEDYEFPDEIELTPDTLARERMKKYRGLKNIRTSIWDPNEVLENTPKEWSSLLRFENYNNTKNRILKHVNIHGAKPGTRVNVYLNTPDSKAMAEHAKLRPICILYSLLPYEGKMTASNFAITPHSEFTDPIKSKDELILHAGPRIMRINPLFSAPLDASSTNNVAKFDRYLRFGGVSIMSITCPAFMSSVPCIVFQDRPNGEGRHLVAQGTYLNSDANRVIVKRAVLTGHPFKIHRRVVTIRYMFFNPQDVRWFKAIPLFTKQGRTGHIQESLGEHGYFKATFDGKIKVQDTVGMSLYKRQYPKVAQDEIM